MEGDVKPPEVKEKLPIKRSKGSLGSLNMITGKNNELGKTSGTSANGAYSKRLFNFSINFLSFPKEEEKKKKIQKRKRKLFL